MKLHLLAILIVLPLLVYSCFEEDQPVPPYMPPDDVDTVSIQHSIYTHQIYFDLSSGEIVAENENSIWVLGFECTADGHHLLINSSDFWGVTHTGSAKFDSAFNNNPDYIWKADKSDGNLDSTAVGDWLSFDNGVPVYSNEVYLIGKFDGISFEPVKKVQFINVDEQSYKFKVAGLEDIVGDTVLVTKDDNLNYVHYSFQDNKVMHLEPNKNEWDILFTQYFTILFTDDGVPAPYYVRGVLQNPNIVESALDTTISFIEINHLNASLNLFSNQQDAIGYDWKSVKVDEGSNSAEYSVRIGYTYLIKDTDADLYKLRFKSFFNELGIKGYPSFEYSALIPE